MLAILIKTVKRLVNVWLGNHMKISSKPFWDYPPHLRIHKHVCSYMYEHKQLSFRTEPIYCEMWNLFNVMLPYIVRLKWVLDWTNRTSLWCLFYLCKIFTACHSSHKIGLSMWLITMIQIQSNQIYKHKIWTEYKNAQYVAYYLHWKIPKKSFVQFSAVMEIQRKSPILGPPQASPVLLQ